ncbi:hypothetical protein JKP88DRAFT_351714 [Tribonema minus]|uniref:Uncharacterized protein n=1 Tax=Tribonema minus TaxID=303371 RepID=A0A835YIC3_9STRA|nr:hypothetical protein JKP88DRAFT_351714 [Tribonema minus]
MAFYRLSKALPYVNFTIATTALTFQITVLHPWHEQLDRDFQALKMDQEAKLEDYHRQKTEKLSTIEHRLSTIARKDSAICHHLEGGA